MRKLNFWIHAASELSFNPEMVVGIEMAVGILGPRGVVFRVFYDPEAPTNAEIKATRGMVLFVVGCISVLIVGFGLLEYLTVFEKW